MLLNSNFRTAIGFLKKTRCEKGYQGTEAFSEPETQALQRLIEGENIDFVTAFFTGDNQYVIPDTWRNTQYKGNYEDIKYIMPAGFRYGTALELFGELGYGNLANYGSDLGVFTILGYISSEEVILENAEFFFSMLETLGGGLTVSGVMTRNKQEGFVVEIFIVNQGISTSIEDSLDLTLSNGCTDAAAEVYRDNERTDVAVKVRGKSIEIPLGTLEPYQEQTVKLLINSNDPEISYELSIKSSHSVRSGKLTALKTGGFNLQLDATNSIILIGTLALLILVLVCTLWVMNRKDYEDEPIAINIPNRPYPGEEGLDQSF